MVVVWGQKVTFRVKRHLEIGYFVIFQFFFEFFDHVLPISVFLTLSHDMLTYTVMSRSRLRNSKFVFVDKSSCPRSRDTRKMDNFVIL